MNGNNIEVAGWQCRCACEECVGAEWGNFSKHDYEAAMADPEMQARELVAACDANAIIAQRDARIEEQAREIERLRSYESEWEHILNEQREELAALKAQPSGVVVAGMADALRHVIKELDAEACEDIDYAQVSGALGAYELLDQGLNSSPVSAGDPCDSCEPVGVFATDGSGPFDCPDCGKKAAAQTAMKTPESRVALGVDGAAQVSAGGVDERAARVPDAVFTAEFMVWWEDHGQFCRAGGGDYERTFAFQAWRHLYPMLMQARAAINTGSAVPDGWVMVPERMHLDASVIESINFHCGDGQEDAGFGSYSDGVLWVGVIEEEDGSKIYGLHIATADYPEEGSTTLVEFAATQAAKKEG